MSFETVSKIKELISPYLESQGIQLVDIHLRRKAGNSNLIILIDKPTGGITLGECSRANEDIGKILDEANIFLGSYVLEISSPGVDRPLVIESDFKRTIGRLIRVFLNCKINEKNEFKGTLKEISDNKIYLKIGEETLEISLEKILKAKQVVK